MRDEFQVGTVVAVRDEYIRHPALKGHTKGTIVRAAKIGTVMVYTVALAAALEATITHGALYPTG